MKTESLNKSADPSLSPKDDITPPRKKNKHIFRIILFGFLFFLAVGIFSSSIWYKNTFYIGFNEFLFTLLAPMAGTGKETVLDILSVSVLPGGLALIPYALFVFFTRSGKAIHLLLRRIGAVTVLTSFIFSLIFAFIVLHIPEFLAHCGEKTLIYKEKYIDPKSVAITDHDGNAHNLIYIYLESIETTYASKEEGGAQNGVNYIPYLTAMAKENVSFSDGEGLGGFHSVTGTGCTMGALLGTTSGVHLSLETFYSQSKKGSFLNGLTTLGDILAEKGYRNSFLVGSDSAFAGTNYYVTVHGSYEISDLYTARECGYVSKNYHNGFWGIEDKYLYDMAKDKLLELSADDEPFNFTMMTIDAHHTGGYRCSLCDNNYSNKLGNVVACADRQLYEFIEWCKEQDFYENTTIIVTGDHPRADNYLVKGVPFYERTVYNCILNSAINTSYSDKNRVFTSLDMFPTTLAAMGFEIEGDRLGLGTNLFSDLPTLCEEMGEGKKGYDLFDTEFKKSSAYYKKNFLKT